MLSYYHEGRPPKLNFFGEKHNFHLLQLRNATYICSVLYAIKRRPDLFWMFLFKIFRSIKKVTFKKKFNQNRSILVPKCSYFKYNNYESALHFDITCLLRFLFILVELKFPKINRPKYLEWKGRPGREFDWFEIPMKELYRPTYCEGDYMTNRRKVQFV